MRALLFSFVLGLLAQIAAAQTTGLQELSSGIEARGWEGVGRLDIDGKGFCTGALIEPDLVLTAAHCLFDRAGGDAVDPSRIEFLAGLRNGRSEAQRSIRAAVVHPSYAHTGLASADQVRHDVALLQLDRPIRSYRIEPFVVSSGILPGSEVGVVSYAQGRENVASLQEVCKLLARQEGVLIMDCDVNFGASGSPIFRTEGGVARLVSVVSAMTEIDGQRVALGMDLGGSVATLRRALLDGRGLFGAPPASARVLAPGERAETGALFVRP